MGTIANLNLCAEIESRKTRIAEIEKEVARTKVKISQLRKKSATALENLSFLEKSYDEKLEIELYDFSNDYYELKLTIDSLKDELAENEERAKQIKRLNWVTSQDIEEMDPEEAFRAGEYSALADSYCNELLNQHEACKNLIIQLAKEADQMKILILHELKETGRIDELEQLENIRMNLEKLQDIFNQSLYDAEAAYVELQRLNKEKSDLEYQIDDIEDLISKLSL